MRFSGYFPLLQHCSSKQPVPPIQPAPLASCPASPQHRLKYPCLSSNGLSPCALLLVSLFQPLFILILSSVPAALLMSKQAFTCLVLQELPSLYFHPKLQVALCTMHSAESSGKREKHSQGQVGSFLPVWWSWRAEGTELTPTGGLRYLGVSCLRSRARSSDQQGISPTGLNCVSVLHIDASLRSQHFCLHTLETPQLLLCFYQIQERCCLFFLLFFFFLIMPP